MCKHEIGHFYQNIAGKFEYIRPKFVYVDKPMNPPSPHVDKRRHLANRPSPLACLLSLCMTHNPMGESLCHLVRLNVKLKGQF